MNFRLSIVLTLYCLLLSGCNHLFLQPSKQMVMTPDQFGLNYTSVVLPSVRGHNLSAWIIEPQTTLKGSIIYFHGNAENISTHSGSVYWLTKHGYRIFAVDYSGYGKSEGVPTLENGIQDILETTHWYLSNQNAHQLPVFVLAQSLGASMSIYAFANDQTLRHAINGFIYEASFASYQQITREVLDNNWITWSFQYPLSWLVHDDYAPQDFIHRYQDSSVLLIHSEQDEIIGFHHAQQLAKHLNDHALKLIRAQGRHNQSMASPEIRQSILEFMNASTQQKMPIP